MKKQYTIEDLKTMLNEEIQKTGKGVWSNRRKAIEEMLRIKGFKNQLSC
jgi:hypothetical protein